MGGRRAVSTCRRPDTTEDRSAMLTERRTFVCEQCGASFTRKRIHSERPLPRTCSPRCRNQARTIPPETRFWSKVEKSPTHWLWIASTDGHGYGHMSVDGRIEKAHALAYKWAIGPIPDGCQIDHLCHVRCCVNPSHLEAVPQRTNLMRGYGPAAVNARKTHCFRGHPFDDTNTYYSRGHRWCRACNRERDRRRRSR